METGLLIARLVLGLAMAAHGAQKLWGAWGGYGLRGTAGFLEGAGFRPGIFFALALALGELGSGALTALGLLGPVGPALMIMLMIVAAMVAHWPNGFFAMKNGIELPVVYATAALALWSSGPGALSLDHVLGLDRLWTPSVDVVVLGLAIVGAVVNLAVRRPATPRVAKAA
jgi:putative oxidoreductase